MNTLAVIPARSLGNKDLEVKYLFLIDLAALEALPLLAAGVGPPFRPDQEVKLDKGEARRAVVFVRYYFLDCHRNCFDAYRFVFGSLGLCLFHDRTVFPYHDLGDS